MTMLHYQVVGADTVGTTTGTIETIGTITCPTNCTHVWGILAQRGSSATTTTAEATQAIIGVNARTLAIQPFQFNAGQPTGAGAATNESSVYDPGIYVPFRAQPGSTPANEDLTFSYDTSIEMTQEDYAQVFLLTSNGTLPDTSVLHQRGDPLSALTKFCDWSDTARDETIGAATSETLDETMLIPGSVGIIHAMQVTVVSDALPTANEHLAGFITITGTIPNLDPMNVPIPLRAAAIGTQVDWPVGMRSYIYPMYIPSGQKNETLTFTVNLAATTSASSVVSVTLYGTRR